MPLPAPVSVAQWLTQLNTTYPALRDIRVLKVAVNKKHALPDALIHDRDEVALFAPATGGRPDHRTRSCVRRPPIASPSAPTQPRAARSGGLCPRLAPPL